MEESVDTTETSGIAENLEIAETENALEADIDDGLDDDELDRIIAAYEAKMQAEMDKEEQTEILEQAEMDKEEQTEIFEQVGYDKKEWSEALEQAKLDKEEQPEVLEQSELNKEEQTEVLDDKEALASMEIKETEE